MNDDQSAQDYLRTVEQLVNNAIAAKERIESTLTPEQKEQFEEIMKSVAQDVQKRSWESYKTMNGHVGGESQITKLTSFLNSITPEQRERITPLLEETITAFIASSNQILADDQR